MLNGSPQMLGRVLVVVALIEPPLMLLLRLSFQSDIPIAIFAGVQLVLVLLAMASIAVSWRIATIGLAEISLIVFLLVMFLSSIFGRLRFDELGGVPIFGPLLMFALWASPTVILPRLVLDDGDLTFAIRALDALGILCALTVLAPALGLEFGEVQISEVTGARRVFGPFGDSIAFVMSFFLLRAMSGGAFFRAALFGVALLLTGGIGALLVTLVGIAWLVLTRNGGARVQRRRRGRLGLGVLALSSTALAVFTLGQGLMQRLTFAPALGFTVGTRIGSFLAAWHVFSNSPWFGVGYTGLKAVSTRYAPEGLFENFSTNYTATAQNQALQTATDAGVIGLAALVFLCLSVLGILRHAANRGGSRGAFYRGMWAWTLGLCLGNQSGVWLLPHSLVPFLFFISAGLAVADLRASRAEMRLTPSISVV